ncbi:bifunctional glutamate--cysteine ligase/glutathione synthetase, partial [Pediococcus acidilactici]
DQWVAEGTTRNNKVALEQPSDQTEFHQEGREILEGMKQMLVELDWLDSLYLVEEALTQMDHPEQTLAAKLYQEAQL